MEIKIKCPAKINLSLKVFPLDKFGFHPIESIMQTINLFDYITIATCDEKNITLNGNSKEIPYNNDNICYKAADLFLKTIKKEIGIKINIQKNIPVCAGLAGGSTDAAGVLYGLNKLFGKKLSNNELHNLALQLGSDLNFCLEGGKILCKGRGEKLTKLEYDEFPISLVKPKKLKISAREAYLAFDNLKSKSNLPNDLEYALLDKYDELRFLNSLGLQMSGSGPTYFIKQSNLDFNFDENYQTIENLKTIPHGVIEIK